jgi:hypothetical protein
MESFGTGPLNVAVTRYEDTEVVKTSQFKEIMLDPKIVARLEVNRDDGATITVTRSPHDQGAVHRPVVIEGVERLQDRTPPTVQIALEPVGGGPDIGSLWYGKCQLRLNVRDEHNEALEAYYRVNGSEWSLYQGPTVLDQWGSLVVEAFATDLVRNRSRSLARRSVQLLDPTQHLRVELEYSSARINAYIRTMEGEEPSQNPVIVYALNDEAPRAYSGGAVPIEYGVGDVRFWFQVRELGHPDYGGRSHTVHTSSIQAAIWGNGVRFSSDTLVRLLG